MSNGWAVVIVIEQVGSVSWLLYFVSKFSEDSLRIWMVVTINILKTFLGNGRFILGFSKLTHDLLYLELPRFTCKMHLHQKNRIKVNSDIADS